MSMLRLDNLAKRSMDELCAEYYKELAPWAVGGTSLNDARFLTSSFLQHPTDNVVEIGTASGVSTGMLVIAMAVAHARGLIGPDFRVCSYDVSPFFYADMSKRVGDAARELLPQDLFAHIEFRHPKLATDVLADFGADQVKFAFIDANHQHPWPVLDFLAILDAMKPGAPVLLHDINLPLLHGGQWQDWGAKYAFDDVTAEKACPNDGETPNIGRIIVPTNKEMLRNDLTRSLIVHAWQTNVEHAHLAKLNLEGFAR